MSDPHNMMRCELIGEIETLNARVAELEISLDSAIHLSVTLASQVSAKRQNDTPVVWRTVDCSGEGTCCYMYNEIGEGEPLFAKPPTCYSAGDMADQGAKAFRAGQASAISKVAA